MTFTVKLEQADGTPAEPPTMESTVTNWRTGDTVPLGRDRSLRVVGIVVSNEDEPSAADAAWRTSSPSVNGSTTRVGPFFFTRLFYRPARTKSLATADEPVAATETGSNGSRFLEIAGPREENLVEEARLLASGKGDPVRIEGVTDPNDPDYDPYENGALLPGPDATLAAPTICTSALGTLAPEFRSRATARGVFVSSRIDCRASVPGLSWALEVERKLATVLFVDLVDSTSLVTSADPEVVRRRVSQCFAVASDLHRTARRRG